MDEKEPNPTNRVCVEILDTGGTCISQLKVDLDRVVGAGAPAPTTVHYLLCLVQESVPLNAESRLVFDQKMLKNHQTLTSLRSGSEAEMTMTRVVLVPQAFLDAYAVVGEGDWKLSRGSEKTYTSAADLEPNKRSEVQFLLDHVAWAHGENVREVEEIWTKCHFDEDQIENRLFLSAARPELELSYWGFSSGDNSFGSLILSGSAPALLVGNFDSCLEWRGMGLPLPAGSTYNKLLRGFDPTPEPEAFMEQLKEVFFD